MPANLLGALLPELIGVGKQVIGRIFPDPAEQQRAEMELLQLTDRARQGQLDINKIEAGHRSIFVAGWRPAIGWTCAGALAYAYILRDLIMFATAIAGVELAQPLPDIDLAGLMPILLGMLGLGGLRTYEKYKGVAK